MTQSDHIRACHDIQRFYALARQGTLADKEAALDFAKTFGHQENIREFDYLVEMAGVDAMIEGAV